MAKMVRKQIYIKPEQESALKHRAKALGVSEAELIRKGLEMALGNGDVSTDLADEAWEEAKRFIQLRMAMKVPQTGRSWTREELYEERIGRFSR
jgi:hypothetical protein